MRLVTFLVEDNAVIRDHLIPAMEDLAGVAVVGFAETEADAIDWLGRQDGQWDLAVVDLFLKSGSGLGVLRHCRRRDANQKIAVLTNYATEQIRAQCKKLGADAVFDKSTELDTFFDYCLRQKTH